MEIEYNYQNNLNNIYNEVFNISIKQKKILLNPNIKIGNFTNSNIIKIITILVISSLISVILERNNISPEIIKYWDIIIILLLFGLYYNQTIFNKNLKIIKQNNKSSKIIIDENQIYDISNGVEIRFYIEKITHIIVGKYSVNVLIETNPLFLFFPIEIKDKIINTLKKYNKDIKIIELKQK